MTLRNRIRVLEIWAVTSIALLGVMTLGGAKRADKFDEITVERLNVVESDGRLLMVAANSARMPDPVVNGRAWKTERPAGMLFYNGLGDENGGLVFGAVEGGGKYGAYHGLSFDKFKQSQTLALVYNDHSGEYRAGLQVWDRPETPLSDILARREAIGGMPDGPEKVSAQEKLDNNSFSPTRVYLGRNAQEEAELTLFDGSGAARIRIVVPAEGEARMDFLDRDGGVRFSLPAQSSAPG